jgi:hypothetical protein
MKVIETKLFNYNELSEDAKKRVFKDWQRAQNEDDCILQFMYDDIKDSIKGLCAALNVQLVDYAYGPYCRNYKLRINSYHETWRGPRALAWATRALVNVGYKRQKTFFLFHKNGFPGVCAFTGCCYDDDIAQELIEGLLKGDTVARAFDGIAYMLGQLCENELEYLTSAEYFNETLDEQAEVYTKDGSIF